MTWTSNAKQAFVTVCLCLTSLIHLPAQARDMVSIAGNAVNMRDRPSTRSDVLWVLSRGYPLQVLARRGAWLRVRDFENDRGWVHRSLIRTTPHHIVKVPTANMRRGPGSRYRIVATLKRLDVLRTLGRRGKWVRVQGPSGRKGWVARSLLWGW